mgnify:CR=1 FL=1
MIDKMWLGFSAGFGRKLVNQYEESPVYKIKSSKSPKLLYDKPLVDKFLSEPCPLDYKFLDKALNSGNPKKVKQTEKFIDLVGVTKEEIAELQPTVEQQIEFLKQKLKDTDYKAIKYAEGAISEQEYAEIKALRQSWRDEINRLESEADTDE